MIIQWDGGKVDRWLKDTGREPTTFIVCERCWDDICDGEVDAEDFLKPENGDPIDKYLTIIDEDSTGQCDICKRST